MEHTKHSKSQTALLTAIVSSNGSDILKAIRSAKRDFGQPAWFSVRLCDVPDKARVSAALSDALRISHDVAEKLIDCAPIVLRDKESRNDAEDLARTLRQSGAEIDVSPVGEPRNPGGK